MPKSHQQQQDLATRLEELKSIFTEINLEIEQIKQSGKLAPNGRKYRVRATKCSLR